MRFLFLLLVFICASAKAQKIVVENISYNFVEKKDWVAFGPGSDGHIYMVDNSGQVYYLEDNWPIETEIQLQNSESIRSLAVHNKIIYYITSSGILFSYKEGVKNKLENNCTDCFFLFDKKHVHLGNNGLYYKLSLSDISHTEISNPKKGIDYISYDNGSKFSYTNDTISWEFNGKDLINKVVRSGVDFFQTMNGKMYVSTGNNLISIVPSRIIQTALPNCNLSDAISNVHFDNREYFIDKNQLIYSLNSKDNCQAQFQHLQNIEWIKATAEGLCIYDANNLYVFNNDSLQTITLENADGNAILDVAFQQNIINVLTRKGGILQKKWNPINNSTTWSEHLHNKDIVNLNCKNIQAIGNTLLCFSPQYGIAEMNGFKYRLHQLPDGGEILVDWNPINDTLIYVKTTKNNIVAYHPQKQQFTYINQLQENWEWVDIGQKAIITETKKIYQKPEDKTPFFVVPIENKLTSANAYLLTTNESSDANSSTIIHLGKNEKYHVRILPEINDVVDFPFVSEITLNKGNQEVYSAPYPIYSADTIFIKNSDWPLTMNLSYAYDGNQSEIITQLEGNKNRYKHSQDIILRNPNLYSTQFDIQTFTKNSDIGTFQTPVFVTKSDDKEIILWKWMGGILIGLLVIIGLILLTKNNRKRKKIEDLDLQNKILELEQKSLQLQMNPHFIFNALNGLQGMIALGKNKEAREYVRKLSELMRSMLNHSRATTVTIREEIELLRNYMEIEQTLHSGKWDYAFDIESKIDLSQRIPPMMIQPFLENSIKHAFKGINYTGEIKMTVTQKGLRLICKVDDNGIGLHTEQKKDHESVALDVIKTRLKNLNQNSSLEEFKIIDKKETGGQGVLVHIVIPIINE